MRSASRTDEVKEECAFSLPCRPSGLHLATLVMALFALCLGCATAGEGEGEEKSAPAGEKSESQGKPLRFQPPLDFSEIGLLAVQDSGRKKSLHTLASERIETIAGRPLFSGTPYWKNPATGEKVQAMDLFLSMWLGGADWEKQPIVLVAYGPLKKELGLDPKKKHFSVNELIPPHGAHGKEPPKRSRLEELYQSAFEKRATNRTTELTTLETEAELVARRVRLMREMTGGMPAACVPHPSELTGTWIDVHVLARIMTRPDSAHEYLSEVKLQGNDQSAARLVADYQKGYKPQQVGKVVTAYIALGEAYAKRESDAFLEASKEFRGLLQDLNPSHYPALADMEREVHFSKLRPFGRAWIFYLFALLLGALTFRMQGRFVFGMVLFFYLLGIAYHVYGFALRCMISGHPPVTNMYESVVWVGLGCVSFGLIFELIYRPKYFMLCGAGGGFLCLVLMDLLPVVSGNPAQPGFEDQIKPLVPVLRDNFWLTVHVLTITLSYAAFALAWVLGHVTLGKHLLYPRSKAEHHQLHQYIYRVLQIGVLLLATGTILGGVWAYYSWGRFWGWDPKEVGAFIALLCYLILLHGRFAGAWSNFALSAGAVLCFQAVMMAWYGVNFILPEFGQGGLHSYGTGSGGMGYVLTASGIDIAFAGAAIFAHHEQRRREAADLEHASLIETDPIADAPTAKQVEEAVTGAD